MLLLCVFASDLCALDPSQEKSRLWHLIKSGRNLPPLSSEFSLEKGNFLKKKKKKSLFCMFSQMSETKACITLALCHVSDSDSTQFCWPCKWHFHMQTWGCVRPLWHLQASNVLMLMAVQRYIDFGHGTAVNKVQNHRYMHKHIPCLLATCYKALLTQLLVVCNHCGHF